jgi:hypothetical protein
VIVAKDKRITVKHIRELAEAGIKKIDWCPTISCWVVS